MIDNSNYENRDQSKLLGALEANQCNFRFIMTKKTVLAELYLKATPVEWTECDCGFAGESNRYVRNDKKSLPNYLKKNSLSLAIFRRT